MNHRTFATRFFRSRTLPILSILALFAGWIGIAGFLLWQVKLKTTVSIMATLAGPLSGGERIALIPPPGAIPSQIRTLDPGSEVELTIEAPSAGRQHCRAFFVGFETKGSAEAIVFRSRGEEREPASKTIDLSQAVRVTFEFRQKRLLSAALGKHALFQ
jgi:hypothetical protein